MREWHGYFINLDRSVDRRASIEALLGAAGLAGRYQRIAAVDGSAGKTPLGVRPGEWGCLQSHLAVLRQAAPGGFIHVLEDDAILSNGFAAHVKALLARAHTQSFDLIFTDVSTDWPYSTIRRLSNAWERRRDGDISLIDLQRFPYSGTDSYFVNPRSLAKVRAFVERHISPITGTLPIDQIYGRGFRSGELTACLTFPFLSVVDLDLATNSGIMGQRSTPVDLLRYAFFIDADEVMLRRQLDSRLAAAPRSPHIDALADIHKLYISSPES